MFKEAQLLCVVMVKPVNEDTSACLLPHVRVYFYTFSHINMVPPPPKKTPKHHHFSSHTSNSNLRYEMKSGGALTFLRHLQLIPRAYSSLFFSANICHFPLHSSRALRIAAISYHLRSLSLPPLSFISTALKK